MALALGAIFALVLSASASAAQPFPKIKRAHELSCSGASAKLALTITWRKANRRGEHRGHAVALVRGRVLNRKVKSRGLRSVRSQSIKYRFRFPKRAGGRELCKGKAKAKVVASHGHNKDGAGMVEIYRVTRKTLGGKGSASGEVGAAGHPEGDPVGRDCRAGGGINAFFVGANAIIKKFAKLSGCTLLGADLPSANLRGANLFEAILKRANLNSAIITRAAIDDANLTDASLKRANLTDASLTTAGLRRAKLTRADLTGANLAAADLTGADLTGANLTGANCSGATKPDGSMYPSDLAGPFVPFVPC